ncbi:dihydrofolate reductase family protein [Spirosoma harenae]
MGKLVLFMHTSLDGFVAGPAGEMDWIHVDDEIFDYGESKIYATDTALYGRVTYQMMESYWPTAADEPDASKHDINHSAWYKKAHKLVLSKSLNADDFTNTTVLSDNLAEQLSAYKQQSEKDIIIFGSPTAAHSLMAENLIDAYWLNVNPVILGEGMPVFKQAQDRIGLRLVDSHTFSSGVICLQYERT